MTQEKRKYTFIDLFAGAGGLSEGFVQAGFEPVAHVEMNQYATRTLETRSVYYYLKYNNRLDSYYDYLQGKITREELFSIIPDSITKSVICETMSKTTLPSIFKRIRRLIKEETITSSYICREASM